jgi:hypothetical protein
MKPLAVLLATLALMSLTACKDSELAQLGSLGSRHKITLYSANGAVIGQWESTGNVSNESQSDGWYFKDEKSGKLIEIAGTMVIEQE